jgi:hypothetical protein
MFGTLCIGIVVKQGYSYIGMRYELIKFLDDNGFEDEALGMDDLAVDDLGLDIICYFLCIKGMPERSESKRMCQF